MTLVFDPFAPLFPRLNGTAAFTAPADVTVGESDLMLTMDLPGLTAEDLEIELLDGHLSVRGKRHRPQVSWACSATSSPIRSPRASTSACSLRWRPSSCTRCSPACRTASARCCAPATAST